MRYELSDIADNLPLRRLQEKVIDILGSVTRVSVETMKSLTQLLAQNPRLKLGRCLAAYACPLHLRSRFGSSTTFPSSLARLRFTSARTFSTRSAGIFSISPTSLRETLLAPDLRPR